MTEGPGRTETSGNRWLFWNWQLQLMCCDWLGVEYALLFTMLLIQWQVVLAMLLIHFEFACTCLYFFPATSDPFYFNLLGDLVGVMDFYNLSSGTLPTFWDVPFLGWPARQALMHLWLPIFKVLSPQNVQRSEKQGEIFRRTRALNGLLCLHQSSMNHLLWMFWSSMLHSH